MPANDSAGAPPPGDVPWPPVVRAIALAFAVGMAVLTAIFWIRMPSPGPRTWLDVRSTPPGATVLVEGTAAGRTPLARLVDLRVEELLGEGRVEVRLAGHRLAESKARRQDDERGARVLVEVRLEPVAP